MISELAEMGYELTDEQQVHAVIRSFPNGWGQIKMVLSQTKDIVTFEDVGQQLEREEECQQATESAEVHMSISNSRNGSKIKDQGNWIGKS